MGKMKEGEESKGKEGEKLLGKPTFKRLENGRFKCVESGHEVPADGRESYGRTKHCRLGLIDAALSRRKPPLNTFLQDPHTRSKLICELTGAIVNKTEEHIWKHINGKQFLAQLEKKELEKLTPKETDEKQTEQTPEGSKKKNKKQVEEEESDLEVVDELWMPSGDRSDIVNGGDKYDSASESELELEDAEEPEAAAIQEEDKTKEQRPSKRQKVVHKEVEPSEITKSNTKKKKITTMTKKKKTTTTMKKKKKKTTKSS